MAHVLSQLSTESVDPLVWATSGVIASTLLLRHLYGGMVDAMSEYLAWCILVGWINIRSCLQARREGISWSAMARLDGRNAKGDIMQGHSDARLPWALAAGIATSAMCRCVTDMRWVVPLIGPCLLLRDKTKHIDRRIPYVTGALSAACLSYLADTSLAVSSLAAAASLEVYWTLANVSDAWSDLERKTPPSDSIDHLVVESMACLIPCFVLSMIFVFMFFGTEQDMKRDPNFDYRIMVLKTAVAACLKAMHWLCLFKLTKQVSWDVAPAILTFSELSANMFKAFASSSLPEYVQAGMMIWQWGALLHALRSVARMLPEDARGRSFLRTFLVVPFFFLPVALTGLPGELHRLVASLSPSVWLHGSHKIGAEAASNRNGTKDI